MSGQVQPGLVERPGAGHIFRRQCPCPARGASRRFAKHSQIPKSGAKAPVILPCLPASCAATVWPLKRSSPEDTRQRLRWCPGCGESPALAILAQQIKRRLAEPLARKPIVESGQALPVCLPAELFASDTNECLQSFFN